MDFDRAKSTAHRPTPYCRSPVYAGVYWAVNIANATVPANLVTLYTKVNTEIAGVTSVRQVRRATVGGCNIRHYVATCNIFALLRRKEYGQSCPMLCCPT